MSKEWIWRWSNLVLTAFVGLSLYTLRIDRRKDIMEAFQEYDKIVAERYLPRRDFDTYKGSHAEYGAEVIKRVELEMTALKVQSELNGKLIFELHTKFLSKQLGAIPTVEKAMP